MTISPISVRSLAMTPADRKALGETHAKGATFDSLFQMRAPSASTSEKGDRGVTGRNLLVGNSPVADRTPVSHDRKPKWYGQFGDLTRFVPAQYKDPNFVLPALPQSPEVKRYEFTATHTGLSKPDLNRAWLAELANNDVAQNDYRTQLSDLRASLNANFDALPEDAKPAAYAARDQWLATSD